MNPQIRKILSYLPAAVVVLCALGIAGNGLHLGAVACQSYWLTSKLRSPEQLPKPGPPATGPATTGLPGAKNAVPGPTPGSPPQMGKGGPPAPPPTPGGAPLPGGKRGQMPQPGGKPGQPGGELGPYQEIVTKGLFSKQQPAPPPVCTGIIAGEALINNTMVKVGGQIGEWKLVEIGVDKVVVEKAGNRMDLKIFPDLQQNPGAFPPLVPGQGESGGPQPGALPPGAGSPGGMPPGRMGRMRGGPDRVLPGQMPPGSPAQSQPPEQSPPPPGQEMRIEGTMGDVYSFGVRQ